MRVKRLNNQHPAGFAALMLLGFVACTAGSVMFREAFANKALWPANGFMVLFYLAAPKRYYLRTTLMAAVMYEAVVTIVGHRDVWYSVLGTVTNLFEAWASAEICLRLFGRRPDFTRPKVLVGFGVLCVLPATMIGGLVFDGIQNWVRGGVTLVQYRHWVLEDGFGIFMVAPPFWVMLADRDRRLFQSFSREGMMALAALLLSECALFLANFLPALFLTFPMLVFISYRQGPVGAARAVIMTNFAAFIFTVAGQGPLAAMMKSGDDFVAYLQQMFVAAATLTALPVAGAIAEQARLRRDLARRETQALRAAAAKAEFLATMSHELRTPLHSIIGFSDVLAQSPRMEGEDARRVGVIREASRSLLTVVDDVLDFSKIEAGRIELQAAPVDLTAWLDATTPIIADLAQRKGLVFTVEASKSALGWRIADEARLRQVLLNLLNNAVKFTDRGGVTLKVSRPSRDSDSVRFAVVDTGIGIAPDAVGSLFQRFQQADGSISRAFGGTGLGLAISKRLVELMNGRIGVESVQGRGSTFWFELPLAACAPVETESFEPAEDAVAVRALLVDDLAANREIGRIVLEAYGCEVTAAASADEALEALEASAFDVVLMDVHMPGTDGLEATRRIRASGQSWSDTPIVAMTANVLPEQVRNCLDAGMNGHVGKPFRPEELMQAIANAVSRGQPDGVRRRA